MVNEEMTLEKFRNIVNEAKQEDATGLLIWKNQEERNKWGGKEEQMWITDAFEMDGFCEDGTVYGDYRNMELSRAIRNTFRSNSVFTLTTVDGKGIAAKAFQIEKLLLMEGHLIFAQRSIFFQHLSGPIVLIPSYRVMVE